MLSRMLSHSHSHCPSHRRFPLVRIVFSLVSIAQPQRHRHSLSRSPTPPPLRPQRQTIAQLLILSCFLISPSSHSHPSTAWSHLLVNLLQKQPPSQQPRPFARSVVAFDRWLSRLSCAHGQRQTLGPLHLTHLLSTQHDPTSIPTQTILYTLNLLYKHAQSPSASTLSTSPADYLHNCVLPHLTHLLSTTHSSASTCLHPRRNHSQHQAQLARLLTHPLVTASPSPDLLLTRLHLLAAKFNVAPTFAHYPTQAWPLLTAHHINALWTLVTPAVPLRSRTSHAPLASLWHVPLSGRVRPNPALLTYLVANVPLANWNTTTWILAAHCPYLNPVDVARAYLGLTRVAYMRQASASYVEWIQAPDHAPAAASAAPAGLVRALNPVVRHRNLLVLTVLLERLIEHVPTARSDSAATGQPRAGLAVGSPNYAIADALLDAARGLDWDTRFLNAVLQGYAASGQWAKAWYVYEDLLNAPDVYTLRIMLKYYARGHQDVPKVLSMVRKRAKRGKVDVGTWGGYWLVRSALMGYRDGRGSASPEQEQMWAADTMPESLQLGSEECRMNSGGPPELPRLPDNADNWDTAHAILTHLLAHDPRSVLPVTYHLLLREYARAGQVTKLERLVREMRARGKMHRETHGLVMMGYVVHMRAWLNPRARYTSGWQTDVIRERGFEDVWRVFEEHVCEVDVAREPVAASAVHWLLVAHPPTVQVAARTLRVLSDLGVTLDESHLRHLWRLAYRLTTRGKVKASVQEVYARFVSQVRRQFGADPEKVGEWEDWIKGYCESRQVFVRPEAIGAGARGGGQQGEVVDWLLSRLETS